MIAPIRESAGLGSPPVAYTTNRNESMNNVAKLHADYRLRGRVCSLIFMRKF